MFVYGVSVGLCSRNVRNLWCTCREQYCRCLVGDDGQWAKSVTRGTESGQRCFQPCTAYNTWMCTFKLFSNIPFHFVVDLNSLGARSRQGEHFFCVVTNITLALFCPIGGPSLANSLFLQMFIFGITPFALRGRRVLGSRAHKLLIEWIMQYLNCVTFCRRTVLSFATKWVFVTRWCSYVTSDMVWNGNRFAQLIGELFDWPLPDLVSIWGAPVAGNVIVTHIHKCTYNKNIHMHT